MDGACLSLTDPSTVDRRHTLRSSIVCSGEFTVGSGPAGIVISCCVCGRCVLRGSVMLETIAALLGVIAFVWAYGTRQAARDRGASAGVHGRYSGTGVRDGRVARATIGDARGAGARACGRTRAAGPTAASSSRSSRSRRWADRPSPNRPRLLPIEAGDDAGGAARHALGGMARRWRPGARWRAAGALFDRAGAIWTGGARCARRTAVARPGRHGRMVPPFRAFASR